MGKLPLVLVLGSFLAGCCGPGGGGGRSEFDWRGPYVACEPPVGHDPAHPTVYFVTVTEGTSPGNSVDREEVKVIRFRSLGYCGDKAVNVSVAPRDTSSGVDVEFAPPQFQVEPGYTIYLEMRVVLRDYWGPGYSAGPATGPGSEVPVGSQPFYLNYHDPADSRPTKGAGNWTTSSGTYSPQR